jgi:hypothetical protein
MRSPSRRWPRYLLAVLLGNGLYFALYPYFPPGARQHSPPFDLGTVIDFWFCLFVYGLLELGAFLEGLRHQRDK